jgi:dual specificity protein kinase YAK1
MQNRQSFIDFVRGLLNINPLERWTPQQAKLHPFITQTKMTGPFVPPMHIKQGSREKSPAPGVVQQQHAEAQSKQRAAAQAQAQAQQNAAYANMQQMNQFPQTPSNLGPPTYNNVSVPYSPGHQQAPPPYPAQAGTYQQHMGVLPQTQIQPVHYSQQQPNLYAQATTRAGRQRANTTDFQQNGIPPALQRVISHLDPNAPIRQQPSPAYYPPPPDGSMESTASSARRRGSRAGHLRGNRDFIRTLEDRTLEEGFMSSQHWQ